MRALLNSFKYAARGIFYCLKNERNMRIHSVAAFYIFIFAPFFTLSRGEKALLLLTIGTVMAAEVINTSIETLVNRLLPSYDQLARIAKDTAAGAVFLCAFFAVLIGLALFWQPDAFEAIFCYFLTRPFLLAALLISVLLAVSFIFSGFGGVKKAVVKRKNKK